MSSSLVVSNTTFYPVQRQTPSGGQAQINIPVTQRFDISIAEAITLFSTPIQILPAFTGYGYFLTCLGGTRQGTRYNAAAGGLRVSYGATTYSPISLSSSIFTSVTSDPYGEIGYPNGGGAGGTPLGISGLGIFINVATSNPTVSGANVGSPISLLLTYILVPLDVNKYITAI